MRRLDLQAAGFHDANVAAGRFTFCRGRELRKPMKRVGVRIGGQAGNVVLADNRIEGFATDVVDNRLMQPKRPE